MTVKDGASSPSEVSEGLRKAMAGLPFPTDAASHYLHAFDLIFPLLINYRGAWLKADRFNQTDADQWFDEFDGDIPSIKGMINHLDIFEDDPRREGEYQVVEPNALASVLTFTWTLWAKQMYGVDILCRIYYEDSNDDEGPEAQTVTFWSRPGESNEDG